MEKILIKMILASLMVCSGSILLPAAAPDKYRKESVKIDVTQGLKNGIIQKICSPGSNLRIDLRITEDQFDQLPADLQYLLIEELIKKNGDAQKAFFDAALCGLVWALAPLVAKGINIDAVDIKCGKATALHLAAAKGHEDVVRFLIEAGTNINSITGHGNTALHIAALNGQEKIVQLLVLAGANKNVININRNTALIEAVRHGRIEIVKFLILETGLDKNAVDKKYGTTILHEAAFVGQKEVVKFLIQEAKVNMDVVDNNGETALDCAIFQKHIEIVDFLKEAKAKMNMAGANMPCMQEPSVVASVASTDQEPVRTQTQMREMLAKACEARMQHK